MDTLQAEEIVNELLAGFPVVIETPVAWGEMDAFGHVNNIIYFRYFESARVEYFGRIGYLESLQETGIGPILASTNCRFRYPLQYPDTVRVGARVPTMETDRLIMEYRVVSRRAGVVAAEGDGLVVSYDYRAKQKTPLPEAVKGRIMELEGGGAS